jgi:nitrilase
MTLPDYPKFKACAAHVAPIFLDAAATVEKACSLIAEAASNGAKLIAFPESYVPGFPVWASIRSQFRDLR